MSPPALYRMLLSSASLPLPPSPPLATPPPLSALFTHSYSHNPPYPSKAQHSHLCTSGPLSTTKKYMRFACRSLVPLLLVLLTQTSVSGSGDGTGVVPTHDDAFPGAHSPRLYYLDNNVSDSQQSLSAPAPALAVGLLALLWVWVLDGAVLSLWVRGSTQRDREAACRCRVCTLRIQARGQPLHDVSVSVRRGVGSKGSKALIRNWSLAWHRYPRQAD